MSEIEQQPTGIEGIWVSKKTGQKVHARDFMMDGDNMIVKTQEGIMIDGREFSDNWIQFPDETGADIYAAEIKQSNGMKASGVKPSAFYPTGEESMFHEEPVSKSDSVLAKILKDANLAVPIDIDTLGLPGDALAVAVKYLDVTVEDIAEYIRKNIKIDAAKLAEELKGRIG